MLIPLVSGVGLLGLESESRRHNIPPSVMDALATLFAASISVPGRIVAWTLFSAGLCVMGVGVVRANRAKKE